jgi:hypothetical protein
VSIVSLPLCNVWLLLCFAKLSASIVLRILSIGQHTGRYVLLQLTVGHQQALKNIKTAYDRP